MCLVTKDKEDHNQGDYQRRKKTSFKLNGSKLEKGGRWNLQSVGRNLEQVEGFVHLGGLTAKNGPDLEYTKRSFGLVSMVWKASLRNENISVRTETYKLGIILFLLYSLAKWTVKNLHEK